jgi:competence protein ComEC
MLVFMLLGYLATAIKTSDFNNKYTYLKGLKVYEGYIIDQDQSSFTIKNYTKGYKVILSLYQKTLAKPGDYIEFHGKISDRPKFKQVSMNANGINAYLSNSNDTIKILKRNSIIMFPVKLKYTLVDALTGIDEEGGTFISGLVTGYTDKLSQDTKVSFMDLGLTHIIAVSGFNLGIIYYFIIIVAQKSNSRTKYILALSVCLLYTTLSGFEPSITRAFIMLSLLILSKLVNRFYDNLSGITLTAFIMLLVNPYYIYNLGFLLSFGATYGIILLNKDIEDKLPSAIAYGRAEFSIGIGAFISTLPIILWLKGYFSIFTILINVLISPFVSLLTILSFLICFVYLIIPIKQFYIPSSC